MEHGNLFATLYTVAGLYNLAIIPFSKLFSDDLGAVDPLFSWEGCVLVALWGLAYASVANVVEKVPLLSLVFAVEKAFYGVRWILWIRRNFNTTLPKLFTDDEGSDPLTGVFFALYGSGDLACAGVFFYGAAKYWSKSSGDSNKMD